MPNWVQNTIRVTKDIEKFKEVFIPNGEIDFNRIIPMPEDLDIQSGGSSYKPNGVGYNDTDKVIIHFLQPIWENLYSDTKTQGEFATTSLETLKANKDIMSDIYSLHFWSSIQWDEYLQEDVTIKSKGYFNYKRYGFVDWHDFKTKQWGTKWNVDNTETYITEDTRGLFITFKTAWSTPFPIFSKLAEQFSFDVLFADEDRGYNMGILHFEKGDIENVGIDEFEDVKSDFERYALANIIWGDDYYITSEELEDIDYEPISEERYNELSTIVAPYLP